VYRYQGLSIFTATIDITDSCVIDAYGQSPGLGKRTAASWIA